jgi:hypothetical protein
MKLKVWTGTFDFFEFFVGIITRIAVGMVLKGRRPAQVLLL